MRLGSRRPGEPGVRRWSHVEAGGCTGGVGLLAEALEGDCKGTSASSGSARFGISISLLGTRHARADGPFIPPFHSPCFSSFPSFPSPRFLLLIYTPFLLLDDDPGLSFPRRHTVYILLYLRARLPSSRDIETFPTLLVSRRSRVPSPPLFLSLIDHSTYATTDERPRASHFLSILFLFILCADTAA